MSTKTELQAEFEAAKPGYGFAKLPSGDYLYEGVQVMFNDWLENNELRKANDRITELQAQLAEQKKANQWIPVSERLPEEGTEVIVYTPPLNGEDEQYTFEKYEDECFIAHSNNYEHFCMVAKGGSDCAWIGPSEKPKYTHWMPMLTAPAIQAEGKQA